ncbi:MAG TPA: hypothetical protein VH092_15265 [Urbifossiella sp.]|nr:hypothetical protein [Urbifossiella sp.]
MRVDRSRGGDLRPQEQERQVEGEEVFRLRVEELTDRVGRGRADPAGNVFCIASSMAAVTTCQW